MRLPNLTTEQRFTAAFIGLVLIAATAFFLLGRATAPDRIETTHDTGLRQIDRVTTPQQLLAHFDVDAADGELTQLPPGMTCLVYYDAEDPNAVAALLCAREQAGGEARPPTTG